MDLKTNKNHPIGTVYSYYFPEVRSIVDHVLKTFAHEEILLQNIHPGLDTYHLPFLEKLKKEVLTDQNTDLDYLPYSYPTQGASEGIFHMLSYVKTHYPHLPLYQLQGEYQGYEALAVSLKMQIHSLREDELLQVDQGVVFISQPSARDGMKINNSYLKKMLDKHLVVFDLAYVGMTESLDLPKHDNVLAVLTSLSKPYGLYYYRVGACFSKYEIPSLYGSRWFKNILSLEIGLQVLTELPLKEIRIRGQERQEKVLKILQAKKSDVYLLGRGNASEYPDFVRANGLDARLCLTPLFKKEDEELKNIRKI